MSLSRGNPGGGHVAPSLPVVTRGRISGHVDAPGELRRSEALSGEHPENPGDVGAKCPKLSPEAAGWVAWMFLAVLWQASLEVQDQALRVQQLHHQEEALEKRLVAAECILQGPDWLLSSSRSGSSPVVLWQN
uniref:Uncharacterized protein n=1 Tax=Rousettus aegyptiacus TaxID=9407 RepID=A0A7J8GAD3_ROUAE|nr:hypothetical protein HJG63_011644 [Rousettus aegyptiacus]